MLYRVLEQGWPEEKALDEATKIGLTSQRLKDFAHQYIASRQKEEASRLIRSIIAVGYFSKLNLVKRRRPGSVGLPVYCRPCTIDW
jgi:hypothetical protein